MFSENGRSLRYEEAGGSRDILGLEMGAGKRWNRAENQGIGGGKGGGGTAVCGH